MALEFPVDSKDAFDIFLLVSRVRNDRHRSLLEGARANNAGVRGTL